INAYAKDVFEMNVIALHDGVAFGKALDGFVITKAGFYYKEIIGKPFVLNFHELKNVSIEETVIERKNKADRLKYTIYIETENDHLEFAVNDMYINGEQLHL